MSEIEEEKFIDILNLKNEEKKPIINNIKKRCLTLSPTVATGLEREAKITDFQRDSKAIGEGAFGSVWKVTHKETQKIYCIKMIQKQGIIEQKLTEQMNREIEIMYLINHPHCLKLKNHFEDNDNFYLIMPLASKGQLYKILQKAKKFDERTTAQVIRETISALKYLHSFNPPIIHRDIKPENLLLNENGRIFLADFGWSNFKKDQDIRTTFCGTPEYIAPEMLRKDGHDHRVDIWSVGVLMFELLSGYSPFVAQTNTDLYQNIRKLKIQWPIDMPPLAKNLISKILKLDPNERLSLDEILNHKWFEQTPIIKPLLKNDLNSKRDILLYHMLNKITPEIYVSLNKILKISDGPIKMNKEEDTNSNLKRKTVMQQIKEKENSLKNSNNHQASIKKEKEQNNELKLQILKLTSENAGLKNKLASKENEVNNLKEENIKLKEEGSKDLKERIRKLTAEIERFQVMDKERLNLLSELEKKDKIIREQNAKIKLQENNKEQISKDVENLNNKIKEFTKQIEKKDLSLNYLTKQNEALIEEKEHQECEYQKKLEILQEKVINANGEKAQSIVHLLSLINDSIQEMKNVFQSKFTSFTVTNDAFKNEFIARNEKFTSILNEKTLSIFEQLKKLKGSIASDVNKVFTEINKQSLDIKDQKIDWLTKQIGEMAKYKKKVLDYENKIANLEKLLNDSNEKLRVSTTLTKELKKNVTMNNENIKKVQDQLNSTESKLSDYKTFILAKAQEDENMLEEYYNLFNQNINLMNTNSLHKSKTTE